MEIYEEIRADRELGARRLVAEYRPRLEAAARMLCQDAHEADIAAYAKRHLVMKDGKLVRDDRRVGG